MINVVCGIRSTGRICTDLAEALESQGHEVKIAYGRNEVPEQFLKYAIKIGNSLDIALHTLKARLLDDCGFGSKRATARFIEWVKRYNPDIIHLHNLHGYYINIEMLFDYLRTCGKKIIWTLHDCWAFTGHSAYCDEVNCKRWTNGCYGCPNRNKYPASYTDYSRRNWKRKRKILNSIPDMMLVTPSKWLADLVKKSFLSKYSVEVIHNGIDTSQFYPMKNDFRDFYGIGNKFMLLGISTIWDEMKGFSDYLNLAKKLGDEYIVVLVGLTKRQICRLPQNVIGIEQTNSIKELEYIYSSADMLLNLSYCENNPIVNLEAMACNTPVLTYNIGGNPETLGETNSIVINKGDIKTAVQIIKKQKKTLSGKELSQRETQKAAKRNNTNESLETIKKDGYWRYKSSLKLIGKKIVLGIAAVWDSRKGLNDFVSLSSTNVVILIVGLTKKQIKTLPYTIIGIQNTNNTETLRMLYAVADVLFNPTYEDNFPTTNIESLCCGTPVITYETGGSPESIGSCGYSAKKGDIGTVTHFLEDLLVTEQCCVDQGKMFSREIMLKQYLMYYSKTVLCKDN